MFSKLTSSQIELLKWLGIVSMVLDHVGVLFYPLQSEFRMVGRLAYPLFGYVLIHNYIFYSKDKPSYIKRLLFLAVISEPLHYALFQKYYAGINIFFVYAMALAFIYIIEGSSTLIEKNRFKKEVIGTLFAASLMLAYFIEYDIRGYILLLSFYFSFKNKSSFVPTLSIFTLFTLDAPYPIFMISSLFVIPVIFIVSKINLPTFPRSKVLFYLFYPLHICILLFLFYI